MLPTSFRQLITRIIFAPLLLAGCAVLEPQPEQQSKPQVQSEQAKKPVSKKRVTTRRRTRSASVKKMTKVAEPAPLELPNVIEAEEFRVVDKEGNVRATLRLGKKGVPGLALYDHDGRLRAVLQVLEDGTPHLLFLDEDGNTPTSTHSLP